MTAEYEYRTEPLQHQRAIFEATRGREYHALFLEQGTGKSKIVIDTAAYLFERGEIDTVIVVAPSPVAFNWVTDEIPKHLPQRVEAQTLAMIWTSQRSAAKRGAAEYQRLLTHQGLSWVTLSYDAFMPERARKFLAKLLRTRRCLYVLDESARIKAPGAKRTKSIVTSAKYAPYRRILTGTPVSNSPLDVYSQVRFLSEEFWKGEGLHDFEMFKSFFAIFKNCETAGGQKFSVPVGYRNLRRLREWLTPISSRVTKDEVLDLPPKVYTTISFEPTAEQKRLTRALKEEFEVEYAGGLITAPLAITRLLRFQQITCGYLPGETEDDPMVPLKQNPRLETLMDFVEDISHKVIIWCRFRADIDQIMSRLGDRAVRFDGALSEEEREEARQAFMHGDPQFFVANPAVGAEGLTLTCAKTVVYYSNSFKLAERLQSEDRAHRIGQDMSVQYVDIVGRGTVDEHIVKSLRKKFNLAAEVTGDELKKWI